MFPVTFAYSVDYESWVFNRQRSGVRTALMDKEFRQSKGSVTAVLLLVVTSPTLKM